MFGNLSGTKNGTESIIEAVKQKNPLQNKRLILFMAEEERFELSVGYEPTPVFKTDLTAFKDSAKIHK